MDQQQGLYINSAILAMSFC